MVFKLVLRARWVALALVLIQATALASQHPLVTSNALNEALTAPLAFLPSAYHAYDEGLFTPLEDLSALSGSDFTHMSHPIFPRYAVRIKKTKFCDGTVNSYTGYIDIEARHLFFYFFESRNDPGKDDVIFWTNGGPGCSSAMGLFMELGPCRISSANGTEYFPYSWNSNANVFFVDQPVGVGFSYAEYGEQVATSEDAAKDIAAFVAIFFENFTQFKGRRFHMAGESYGGRYVPLFASAVYDQNPKLVEVGLTPINLVSVIIGNGGTEMLSMILSYYDMQCTSASVPPILDIASCVRMKQAIPRCSKWLKASCTDVFDAINCNAAAEFCFKEFGQPIFTTPKNPYDLSKDCDGGFEDALCYPITKNISAYLDLPTTRTLLGVSPSLSSRPFSSCSNSVGLAFRASLDALHTTPHHIAALLEHDIKALIYVGTYDWICNWIGNERWTLELDWSGKEEFGKEPLRVWNVEGNRAGRTRSAGGLTYATVEGAGHMVPYDKPKEALALVNRWVAGMDL